MTLLSVYNALQELSHATTHKKKMALAERFLESIGRPFYMTLTFATNPALVFHVAPIEYIPNPAATKDHVELFDFLYLLTDYATIPKNHRETLTALASSSKETVDVVNRIITKKLKCGIGAPFVNELTQTSFTHWLMTPGYVVRCWPEENFIDTNLIVYLRRSRGWKQSYIQPRMVGERYKYREGFYHRNTADRLVRINEHPLYDEIDVYCSRIREYLKYSNPKAIVELDGVVTESGEYHVSDIPSLNFKVQERLQVLSEIEETDHVKFSKPLTIDSESDMVKLFMESEKADQSGFTLKQRGGQYVCTSSREFCEIKRFDYVEVPVLFVKESLDPKERGKLIYFKCEYGGKEFRISKLAKGKWLQKNRIKYLKHPPKRLGLIYNDTLNADGSLLHPRIISFIY